MTTERKKHHPIRRTKKSEAQPHREQGGKKRYGAAKKPDELEDEDDSAPRRERRALSHVGGEVLFKGGTKEEHDVLLRALDVSAEEEEVMVDVHGFHSYPARLHPLTARALIEGFSRPGARVLDPFCGSGTVIVEARALSREAIGSDLNPLAVELSWLKSRGPTKKLVEEMVLAAARIADVAEERRLKKAEPYRRYSDEDRERYPIHMLLEIDSISHGIHQVPNPDLTRMLRLVASSMLTKISHSEGDTTRRKAPRRLPSGFAIQLFHQKAEELGRRLDDYRNRLPDKAPRAYIGCSDARQLEKIEHDSIDLVVTSPPYPGVYDYLDHHLHRIQFLGLKEGALREREIGARREYRFKRLDEAAQQWRNEIGPTLNEIRRTLAQDGRGVIIVADSVVDGRPLYADEQLEIVAERAGIDITCIASQERPLFLHGAERAFSRRPRMEHVVLFRPGERKKRKLTREEEILAEAEAARDARERPARFQKPDQDDAEHSAHDEDRPPRRDFQSQDHDRGFRQRDDGPPRRDFRSRDDGGFRPQGDGPRRDFRSRDDGGFRPQGDGPPRRDFRSRDDGGFRPQGDGPPRRDFRSQGDGPPRRDFRSQGDGPPRRDFRSQGDGLPRRDFRSRDDGGFRPQGDGPPRRDFRSRSDDRGGFSPRGGRGGRGASGRGSGGGRGRR